MCIFDAKLMMRRLDDNFSSEFDRFESLWAPADNTGRVVKFEGFNTHIADRVIQFGFVDAMFAIGIKDGEFSTCIPFVDGGAETAKADDVLLTRV